jgi:hypothetical protein
VEPTDAEIKPDCRQGRREHIRRQSVAASFPQTNFEAHRTDERIASKEDR